MPHARQRLAPFFLVSFSFLLLQLLPQSRDANELAAIQDRYFLDAPWMTETAKEPVKKKKKRQGGSIKVASEKKNYGDEDWKDLPLHVKNAAKILGFDQEIWNLNKNPRVLYKSWKELTIEQANAATLIGRGEDEWVNPPELHPFDKSKASDSSNFDPWIKDYIKFHRSNIKDGKLKKNAKYLIYQCLDGEEQCGGLGARVMGMTKMLYFAMCTNRVLLIDAPFPIPLSQVLNPGHVQWNATFPETTKRYEDMDYLVPLDKHDHVRGFRVPKANGVPQKKSMEEMVNGECMQEHFDKNGWSELSKPTVARAVHQAFWALFQIDDAVLNRAEELKASAKITGPYVGLHIRKGDHAIFNQVARREFARATNEIRVLNCYRRLQYTYPQSFAGAFLASDDYPIKEKMKEKDPTIHFAQDLRAFHIDKATRNADSFNDMTAYQGVVDTWAEIMVLVDSMCLVMTKSMFDVAAYYIRGPQACSIYLETCNNINEIKRAYNSYAGENVYINDIGRPFFGVRNEFDVMDADNK